MSRLSMIRLCLGPTVFLGATGDCQPGPCGGYSARPMLVAGFARPRNRALPQRRIVADARVPGLHPLW